MEAVRFVADMVKSNSFANPHTLVPVCVRVCVSVCVCVCVSVCIWMFYIDVFVCVYM